MSDPLTDAERRQCWRTPLDLWGLLQDIYRFDIDAAADSKSALLPIWFGPNHPTPEMRDGLAVRWADHGSRVYCNPGFGNPGPWAIKGINAVRQDHGRIDLYVQMSLIAAQAKWWGNYTMAADEIIMLSPRPQFVAPPGIKQSGNARENCLLVYRQGPTIPNSTPRVRLWRWG